MIVKTWKQRNCFSVGDWINCHLLGELEYYPALKRNEQSGHEKTHRNLKCTLLSEISQFEKTTY